MMFFKIANKLDLKIWQISVYIQKIYETSKKIQMIIEVSLKLIDNLKKSYIF